MRGPEDSACKKQRGPKKKLAESLERQSSREIARKRGLQGEKILRSSV